MKLLVFIILSLSSMTWANFEADFLDRITEHHRQTIAMSELAQKKSSTPELKRIARKIIRHTKRELRQITKWREAYFENYPQEYWEPETALNELKGTDKSEFDVMFLTIMVDNSEKTIDFLKEVSRKARHRYVIEFAKDSMRQMNKDIKEMNKFKAELLGTK